MSKSVLFVDDNEDLRRLMTATLARRGHRVVGAADGLEAMQHLRTERFDVAVVDMIMPRKEGLATIMEMKLKHPEMHVIAMSGGGNLAANDLTRLGEIVGADEALSKPFTPSRLAAVIDRMRASQPAL